MKAVVVRSFGGPEVLELLDWPDPAPGPADVLIGVRAVTVGRALDVEVRERGADFHARLPRILGSDPAGVVVAVGDAVAGVAVGDRVVCTSSLFCGACTECRAGATNACVEHRVVGVHIDGGDAELCAVPASSVVGIPDGVSFEQAASMAVSYPVAWNLLVHAGLLARGDDVLIMGAGGGLGIAGVLIAKALGARVIAAAASESKRARCRELLGADEVVDYSRPGWSQAVRDATADGRGVAVVYENISSPALFGEALSCLRPYGRLVTCGSHGGGVLEIDMRTLYRGHLAILGDTGAGDAITRAAFQAVADGVVAAPPVFHRFALEQAAAAHEAARGRELFGRAVLTIPARA